MNTRKQRIIDALRTWIKQRPGLDYCDYDSVESYRSEQRRIARQLSHARTLLAAVEYDDAITVDDIIDAAQHAYSGRLNIVETVDDVVTIDYCAGHYWPTEYRAAVCAVLAYALWACERDRMPESVANESRDGYPVNLYLVPGHKAPVTAGDYLRITFGRRFGASIVNTCLN